MEAQTSRVTLGRVAGVYGVKGWIKLHSYTRPIENILSYPRWHIVRPDYEARLIEGRVHGGGLIAQISGPDGQAIDDRDVAVRLVGADIQVAREALPEPPAGSWYWSDLVGLDVVSDMGEPLGRVVEVTENGAQDVLVVRDEAGSAAETKERLIPFVHEAIILSVDMDERRIVANWAPDW